MVFCAIWDLVAIFLTREYVPLLHESLMKGHFFLDQSLMSSKRLFQIVCKILGRHCSFWVLPIRNSVTEAEFLWSGKPIIWIHLNDPSQSGFSSVMKFQLRPGSALPFSMPVNTSEASSSTQPSKRNLSEGLLQISIQAISRRMSGKRSGLYSTWQIIGL